MIAKLKGKSVNSIFTAVKSILLGKLLTLWYTTTNKKIKIGKNLRVEGFLSIRGPGTVIIGNNVKVGVLTTPWTTHEDAVLEIQDNVYLNGTRFACAKSIIIGEDTMLADCRIMDTNFHTTDPNHRRDEDIPKPVRLGKNTWITMQVVVLKGSNIGDNSIVSANSVVYGKIPANKIVSGNPAKVIGWCTPSNNS